MARHVNLLLRHSGGDLLTRRRLYGNGDVTGPPVFDSEPLHGVADTVDLEFAREVAELYLLQLDDLAAAVGTGLRDGDDDAGQRAAHTLKASSGQVGAAASWARPATPKMPSAS